MNTHTHTHTSGEFVIVWRTPPHVGDGVNGVSAHVSLVSEQITV